MRRVTLTFPAWTTVHVPDNIAALAHKRTQHLIAMAGQRNLGDLLRDAYVQGLHDIATIKDTWNGQPLRMDDTILVNAEPNP